MKAPDFIFGPFVLPLQQFPEAAAAEAAAAAGQGGGN